MSSDEKARSRIAFACGRKLRYFREKLGVPPLEDSKSRTPPSSSPMATREFANQWVSWVPLLVSYWSTYYCNSLCRKGVLYPAYVLQCCCKHGRPPTCYKSWLCHSANLVWSELGSPSTWSIPDLNSTNYLDLRLSSLTLCLFDPRVSHDSLL